MLARAKMLLFTALLLGLAQSHTDTQAGGTSPLSVEIDQPRSLVLEKVSSQRTANGIEVSGRGPSGRTTAGASWAMWTPD